MTEHDRTHCLRYLIWDANKENPDDIGDAITLARRLGDSLDGINTQSEVVLRCKEPGCALYIALGQNALRERDETNTHEAGVAGCEYEARRQND